MLANLPRLERLAPRKGGGGASNQRGQAGERASLGPHLPARVFVCRPLYMYGPDPCEHCWGSAVCAGAAAARELVMHGLPAGGAAAGRRLAVNCGKDAPEWSLKGEFSSMVYASASY